MIINFIKKALILCCLTLVGPVKPAENFSSSFFDEWTDFDANSFFDPSAPILPENPSFPPEQVDSSFGKNPSSASPEPDPKRLRLQFTHPTVSSTQPSYGTPSLPPGISCGAANSRTNSSHTTRP